MLFDEASFPALRMTAVSCELRVFWHPPKLQMLPSRSSERGAYEGLTFPLQIESPEIGPDSVVRAWSVFVPGIDLSFRVQEWSWTGAEKKQSSLIDRTNGDFKLASAFLTHDGK